MKLLIYGINLIMFEFQPNKIFFTHVSVNVNDLPKY